jgi:hypothetical protein
MHLPPPLLPDFVLRYDFLIGVSLKLPRLRLCAGRQANQHQRQEFPRDIAAVREVHLSGAVGEALGPSAVTRIG